MKRLSIIAFLVILGCSQSDLELPSGNQLLVVEGWITDQEQQHSVRITRTTAFNGLQPETVIDDANVTIESRIGLESINLSFDVSGVYYTPEMSGNIGEEYRISIQLNSGETIQSEWELLNPLVEIDTLFYRSFIDQDEETGEDIDIYYPVVVSAEPSAADPNYYRYRGYRHNSLLNEPEELILLSDRFVNGKDSLPNHIPEFRYSLNEQIKVELQSINKPAYDFLTLLKNQTTSLGSSSGTSPAKLIGNLRNVTNPETTVLGYFGATSVSQDSIIVNE